MLTELRHGLEGGNGHARTRDDLDVRCDAGVAHRAGELEERPLPRLVIERVGGADDQVRVAICVHTDASTYIMRTIRVRGGGQESTRG